MTREGSPREGLLLVPAFVLVLVLPVLLIEGARGSPRILLLVFAETALLAVTAPAVRRTLTVVAIVGSSAIAAAALALLLAPAAAKAAVVAHLPLLAWAGCLHALARAIGRGIGDRPAVLIVSGAGLLLVLAPLGLDPVLDLAGGSEARSRWIRMTLLLHPPSGIASSLFETDWIREGTLYDRARFPSTDAFVYPAWYASTVLFGAVWMAAAAAGRLAGGGDGG